MNKRINACNYSIGAHTKFPKSVYKDRNISSNAKVLYLEMLDLVSLSIMNGWKNSKGVYIQCTLSKTMEILNSCKNTAIKTIRELEELDLIEKDFVNNKQVFYVKLRENIDVSENEPEEKKKPQLPSMDEINDEFCQKNYFLLCLNMCPCESICEIDDLFDEDETDRTDELVSEFLETNIEKKPVQNINTNNTYRIPNRNNLIYLGSVNHSKDDKTHAQVIDDVRKQINYSALMQSEPNEQNRIDEIVGIIADIIESTKNNFRVNRQWVKSAIVKEQLSRIKDSTIRYILSSLDRTQTEPVNKLAYLLTTLFNAPNTETLSKNIQGKCKKNSFSDFEQRKLDQELKDLEHLFLLEVNS